MDVIETIYKRRSIRNYLDKQVEKDMIITLLKAATAAPTAANCQPWEFIVIDEAEKLSELKDKLIFARYLNMLLHWVLYMLDILQRKKKREHGLMRKEYIGRSMNLAVSIRQRISLL